MQCVILAGGLGTRISSVSGGLPKALIPVSGRPFAFHQLDWLVAHGVTDVVYCIGHKGHMLRDVVGSDADRGLKITFCDEGNSLRGTGGAIRLAHDRSLLDEAFFVLYADSYLPIDMLPVWRHAESARQDTMVVIQNDGRWDASNVAFGDGRVIRYEKNLADPARVGMRFIDYGLSVLGRATIADRVESGVRADLAELYTGLSRDGRLLGYEVHQRFYEIGSPSGLAALEAHFISTSI